MATSGWGKGRWGKSRWGKADTVIVATSKFHSYISKSNSTGSKFHSSVAFSPTPKASKFHSYIGFYPTAISSKFHSYTAKLVLSCFHSYTAAEMVLSSKFHSSLGTWKTAESKFHSCVGGAKSTASKFHSYNRIDRLIGSKFHAYVGDILTKTSKFHSNVGAIIAQTCKFHSYRAATVVTSSKFHGSTGFVPVMLSKFHSYCFKPNYYEIAGINISDEIRDMKPVGWGLKAGGLLIPGSDEVELVDNGTELGQFIIQLNHSDESDNDAFLKTVTNQLTDTTAKIGRSDRYILVKRVSVAPVRNFYLLRKFTHVVTLHCCRKTQIAAIGLTSGGGLAKTLSYKSDQLENFGSATAMFTFVIGGYYDGGHSEALYAKLYDDDNTTVLATLPISTKLLSDETATLDESGVLTCNYSDTFVNNVKYPRDSIYVNCVWSAGKVRISPSGYIQYKLSGPILLSENIKATLDLTRVAGSPTIKVSTDGVSFIDAIPYAEIVDGSAVYWLTGSAKYADVWIRINCPAGATLDINGVAFESKREIAQTSYYNQLPVVPAGETRALEITGTGGSGKANVTVTLNSRWAV